jgi:hypothetical protein
LSITKRVLALAAAGATALVLGGVLATSHSATRVDAAGASSGAIGCAASQNTADIAFAASGAQVTAGLTVVSIAPATLSIFNPSSVVECGAVFQDLTAGGVAGTATDLDPNTIDGGTITYNITGGGGFAQILESNGPSVNINCGSTTLPTGTTTAATLGTAQVQTVTITGATAGTFTLTNGTFTTGAIAFNASVATIQAALLGPGTTVPAGTVVGGTTALLPFTITSPISAGATLPVTVSTTGLTGTAAVVAVTAVAGVNAVQTLTFATVPVIGSTLAFTFPSLPTSAAVNPLSFTLGADIQAVINGVLGAGTVTVVPAGNSFFFPQSFSILFNAPGPRALPVLVPLPTAVAAGTPTIATTTAGVTPVTGVTGAAAIPVTSTVVTTTAFVAPTLGVTTVTAPGGLESCQGAVPSTVVGAAISPNAGNVVHIGFRPGATFGLLGNSALTSITITATYTRYPSLTASGFAVGPSTLTVGPATITLPQPVYAMVLTASPTTIPAAIGGGGSVITAQMFRATNACLPITVSSITSGFFVCSAATSALLFTGATGFTLGSEPGVITFTTSDGFFSSGAGSGTGTTFAQQVASVQCGAVPGTSPLITFPTNFVGLGLNGVNVPFFGTTGCNSAAVTLNGGGAVGDAVVTADFVGDFTGATAFASTSVAFGPTAATVALSRGCNEVLTPANLAGNASATAVLALVSPSSVVVSIWQFNNSLHAFQALFFNTAGAPTDISSVGPNQSIFICVSGAATFATGAF